MGSWGQEELFFLCPCYFEVISLMVQDKKAIVNFVTHTLHHGTLAEKGFEHNTFGEIQLAK